MSWFRRDDDLVVRLIQRVVSAEMDLQQFKEETRKQFEEYRIRLSAPQEAPKRKSATGWLEERRELTNQFANGGKDEKHSNVA